MPTQTATQRNRKRKGAQATNTASRKSQKENVENEAENNNGKIDSQMEGKGRKSGDGKAASTSPRKSRKLNTEDDATTDKSQSDAKESESEQIKKEPEVKKESDSSDDHQRNREPDAPDRKDKQGAHSGVNHNRHLTDMLEQLAEMYEAKGDRFRQRAYDTACMELEKLPRIDDVSQLKGVYGFGPSITKKVDEILNTGKLRKLQELKHDDPHMQQRLEFCKIWGVGPAKARSLIQQGFKSLDDLRARGMDQLNERQKIGLSRLANIQERIPRAEVTEITKLVNDHVQKMLPGAELLCAGSYRRGLPDSGDVDIIIGPPPGREEITILPKLVKELESSGLITDNLLLPAEIREADDTTQDLKSERGSKSSYMGMCKLPHHNKHRRLDIKTYPRHMFPCAVFYYTGSGQFNRQLRLYAKHHGYFLNDEGLYKRGPNDTKGKSIPIHSEEDIFSELGLPYKEPHEREVFDHDMTDPHGSTASHESKRSASSSSDADDMEVS